MEERLFDGLTQLCIEAWKEYHSGMADYETMDVRKYSKRFAVAEFPKALIAPVLLKRSVPTEEDAANLRVEINRYVNSHRRPSKEEAKAYVMEEQTAIAILKKRGYRVMKKTTAYIDL